jgi:glycine cleavage system regulatory protein
LPTGRGALAALASLFAGFGVNIIFFHYNRSEHPNRVVMEVAGASPEALEKARAALFGPGLAGQDLLATCEASAPGMEPAVLDARNILSLEVRLDNRPGTLGRFAGLLAEHGANVIYMAYNEAVSETSALFSLATRDPEEIDRLLKEMNARGYYYAIRYRGAGRKEIEDVIGLNLAERFFLGLKGLLGSDNLRRLKRLVESSARLTGSLLGFSQEAGRHFDEGNVITSVLAFASESVTRPERGFPSGGCRPLSLAA